MDPNYQNPNQYNQNKNPSNQNQNYPQQYQDQPYTNQNIPNQEYKNQQYGNQEYPNPDLQNQNWRPPNTTEETQNLTNINNTFKATTQKKNNFFPNSNISSKPFNYKDENIRSGFIRKVYLILSTQLIITFLFILISFNVKSFREFQRANTWLLWVSIVLTIVLMYALGCYKEIARKVPLNYILLLIFTLAESYVVSFISSQYDKDTVLMAGAMTVGIVIALTLYAIFTKTDFTGCGPILLVCVVALILGGILSIFFYNKWLNLILSVIGVIVFGIYLVMDTQLVIGKNSKAYSIDDYIMAAMNLYIDIIQIFLYLLQILGAANGN